MSDADGPDSADGGLASTRSRRERNVRHRGRKTALEAFKNDRKSGRTRTDDEDKIVNVYDVVDESEYSELVANRQNDDWLVGDEEGENYVEDGREIFDEEVEPSSTKKPKKANNKTVSKVNASSEDTVSSMSGRSIKKMFANMPKKTETKGASNQEDEILGNLLSKIKTNQPKPLVVKSSPSQPPSRSLPAAAPSRRQTGIKREVAKQPLEEVKPSQNVEEFSQEFEDDNDAIMAAMDDPEELIEEHVEKENDLKPNRGFAEAKVDPKPNKKEAREDLFAHDVKEEGVLVELDGSTLPLIKNESGDKVLRMYWLDAYEDPFKHAGTVWLFGKVYIEKAKAFVSCCVAVKNVERNAFLLKRESKVDVKSNQVVTDETGEPVSVGIGDVYEEFNSKIAVRYKIPEFKSKPARMSYAFELEDVPDVGDYLEILYNPKYQALPSDLKGETFSRVFAANQSSLERFLLSRKIKGPSWIDIKGLTLSNPATSWCKVEAVCSNPNLVSVVTNNPPSPPPLNILTVNIKTVINPKTLQNEIAVVSGLIHPQFYLDKPAPKPAFSSHFCALTRPSDEVWPFDLAKVMSNQSSNSPKIDKMDSERALLAYLLAKIGKFDPDLIMGHDVSGFDLDVILHRAVVNKIPNWSRMGRLKRSIPPFSSGRGGKVNDKLAVTGRLVCDLKISAKELIRCKSYDLPSLAEKILNKPAEGREQVDSDAMRASYGNSKELLKCANVSLVEAADTLQVIYHLYLLLDSLSVKILLLSLIF